MTVALIVVSVIALIEWVLLSGALIRFKGDGDFTWSNLGSKDDYGVNAKVVFDKDLEELLKHNYIILRVKYSAAPIDMEDNNNE